MKPLILLRIAAISLLILSGCSHPSSSEQQQGTPLPEDKLSRFSLGDLSEFKPTDSNWQIAGDVFSLPEEVHSMEIEPGTGILVNKNDETHRKNIFTGFEHEDIEIEWEFMMPKGSNSGVYFQSRYEVQLFDSWKKVEVKHSDCGGIYERWDETRPEGEKGYEGKSPAVNAALAPGLWQRMRVIFRAPRFDEKGRKTENARFVEVIMNGITIHEDVEVTGPTRAAAFADERPAGPIMIQGDHGPVAFRNIRYRLFSRENLSMDKIQYRYFHGRWDVIPPFDSLEARAEGQTRFFDLDKIKTRENNYGIRFQGSLPIVKEGEYAFTIVSDDGSRLVIDGQMIADNDGLHGEEARTGKIFLSEGSHELTLDYFQATGGAFLQVFAEGPGIPYSPFHSPPSLLKQGVTRSVLPLSPRDEPELLRSFSMFGNEKRTHVMNVGNPEGMHYAYDLSQGTLLKVWRGAFLNVAPMWEGRGETQLSIPMGTAVEICGTPALIKMDNPTQAWPDTLPPQAGFYPRGYTLDNQGYPSFSYSAWETSVSDKIIPDTEKGTLKRTIVIEANVPLKTRWVLLARGEKIKALSPHTYNVGGKYYLHYQPSPDQAPVIRQSQGMEELIVPVLRKGRIETVSYELEW
ncbi:MAG: family 16 glycoside hydrolase [Bacteroidia bacterium]